MPTHKVQQLDDNESFPQIVAKPHNDDEKLGKVKDIRDMNKSSARGVKRPHEDDNAPIAAMKRPREEDDATAQETERPRDRDRPPPEASRPRKRPGGAARIRQAELEAAERRRRQREAEANASRQRGNEEVVRQHYNAVPERGRDWRKTDSRIKGLRSFNNWVKSTVIHKFSPGEPGSPPLKILDIGCGKGGDLQKWQKAPQPVELYVGVDPAEVSIEQARDRYRQMRSRGGRGYRGRGRGGGRSGYNDQATRLYDAEFIVSDAFTFSLGDLQIIREVGFGPGSRWGPSGGFDCVSMMFCMHYAFENEVKAKGMLANVSGSLKKGGRFFGVIPNSDILRDGVTKFHQQQESKQKTSTVTENEGPTAPTFDDATEPKTESAATAKGDETSESTTAEWGNSIYRVRFPGDTPKDGIFRPQYGWKYSYFMEEAVEEVPEYIVPWEAFRAIAEDYNLELQYRKPFADVWKEEKRSPVFGPLSEQMGVRGRDGGSLLITDEEMEAASFYHAFCFYKI